MKKGFKLRDKAHAKFKQSPCAETHLAYTIARRDANSRKFEAKKYYDEKVARKLSDPTTSPKEYWRLTKKVYGKKVASSIPPIIDNNIVYSNPVQKANLFNNHFSAKSKLPLTMPDLPEFSYVTGSRLDSVRQRMKKLKRLLMF